MEFALLALCFVLMVLVGGILARNLLKGTWDLLSWRNLFLIGYTHFVLLSAYFSVSKGYGLLSQGLVTNRSMMMYLVFAPLFLGLFLGTASFMMKKGWFQRLIPRIELPITTPAMLVSITVLIMLALFVTLLPLPAYLKMLGAQFRSGMAITAVGLATYWALANRFNPVSWAVLLGCLGLAFVVSIVGGIGRRDAVAALVAIPWMWYFAKLRYKSPAQIAIFVGSLAAAGTIFIAAYTVIRFKGVEGETGPSAGERLSQLTQMFTNWRVTEDAIENMLYTDTAGNTMFIFENYPSNYPYMTGHSLHWMLVNPIPRSLYGWEKPEALGIILREHMNQEANLGPGILGQTWTEGGTLALIVFAIGFGVMYGTMDRALRDRCWNPYFVAVAGCGAGNVLAMPRGDIALFTIQIMASMIGSGAVLLFLKPIITPVARAFPPLRIPGLESAPQPALEGGHDEDAEEHRPDAEPAAEGQYQ